MTRITGYGQHAGEKSKLLGELHRMENTGHLDAIPEVYSADQRAAGPP